MRTNISVRRTALSAALALFAGIPALGQGVGVVVTDDFANPATGWTMRAEGVTTMGYVAGAYRIVFAGRAGFALATSGTILGDGVAAIDAQNLPDAGPHAQGIVVRAQDARTLYGFVIASDGAYTAFQVQDGGFVRHSSRGQYLPPGVYRTGEPNRIEARAAGDTILYSVNGREIFEVRRVLWPTGFAGIIASNAGDQPTGTIFDNWRVEAAP